MTRGPKKSGCAIHGFEHWRIRDSSKGWCVECSRKRNHDYYLERLKKQRIERKTPRRVEPEQDTSSLLDRYALAYGHVGDLLPYERNELKKRLGIL